MLGVVAAQLGWRRCFGLHLWYKLGCGSDVPPLKALRATLQGYATAWQKGEAAGKQHSAPCPSPRATCFVCTSRLTENAEDKHPPSRD